MVSKMKIFSDLDSIILLSLLAHYCSKRAIFLVYDEKKLPIFDHNPNSNPGFDHGPYYATCGWYESLKMFFEIGLYRLVTFILL